MPDRLRREEPAGKAGEDRRTLRTAVQDGHITRHSESR
nr:MAG TPA: hypothetical protein [Caudoviricetes sp.]